MVIYSINNRSVPTCVSLLSCPNELPDDKNACKSAYAAFSTDEYCCTGTFNESNKWKASQYAYKSNIRYPGAYDDVTTSSACDATPKYTATFPP